MIDTPVVESPAMIARSIGAAPRQRGSSEGCTLRMWWAASSSSLISAPNAHTTEHVGRRLRDAGASVGVVDGRGLVELDPELAGGDRHRRRRQPSAAAPGPVRARDDQLRAVWRGGQALEHRRGELARPEIDGAHAGSEIYAASASRSARIASLR